MKVRRIRNIRKPRLKLSYQTVFEQRSTLGYEACLTNCFPHIFFSLQQSLLSCRRCMRDRIFVASRQRR